MAGRFRVVVLGGSSPFTVELLSALTAAPGLLAAIELVCMGRNADALRAVVDHARARLGPDGLVIRGTTDLDAALEGADVVLHQIRYGGLAARHEDHLVARSVGLAGDETLGPGGLRAAIRYAAMQGPIAAAIARRCPDAWVLNMANPLGVTTSALADAGLTRVIGVCELPLLTAQQVAARVGVTVHGLTWHYSGLNHRGFLHGLAVDGHDVLPDLVGQLADDPETTARANVVQGLGGWPLKYFWTMTGPASVMPSRATEVASIRSRALRQLAADPIGVPAALSSRHMPWYRIAIVPTLAALLGFGDGSDLVVTLPGADGVATEHRAVLVDGVPVGVPSVPPPTLISDWIARTVAHERAVVAAARQPTRGAITAACRLDPMVPRDSVDQVADAVFASLDPKWATSST